VRPLFRSSRPCIARTPVLQHIRSIRPRLSVRAEAIEAQPYNVPENPESTARQALDAVKRALKDGVYRQRIELMLPLIGATDLDDWPGGIRQQFKAALPMVEQILQGLKSEVRR